MEFYVDDVKNLRVTYNNVDYSFSDFWSRVQDAREICYTMYNELSLTYPDRVKSASIGADDWLETLLRFINNHLREYNSILDVIIRTSRDITINMEIL